LVFPPSDSLESIVPSALCLIVSTSFFMPSTIEVNFSLISSLRSTPLDLIFSLISLPLTEANKIPSESPSAVPISNAPTNFAFIFFWFSLIIKV
jgi:hypothetical protein